MGSFDVVSEVDMHELRNAVDQANREVATRFDFRGTGAAFELAETEVTLRAPQEFHLQQMLEILRTKFAKRKLDTGCMDVRAPEVSLNAARQRVLIKQGVDPDSARKMVKAIKDAKIKVQAQIQGDQVRVTGKKRDDLQQVMAKLRDAKLGIPLQFNNFRD